MATQQANDEASYVSRSESVCGRDENKREIHEISRCVAHTRDFLMERHAENSALTDQTAVIRNYDV